MPIGQVDYPMIPLRKKYDNPPTNGMAWLLEEKLKDNPELATNWDEIRNAVNELAVERVRRLKEVEDAESKAIREAEKAREVEARRVEQARCDRVRAAARELFVAWESGKVTTDAITLEATRLRDLNPPAPETPIKFSNEAVRRAQFLKDAKELAPSHLAVIVEEVNAPKPSSAKPASTPQENLNVVVQHLKS
jgi:hypothetical protein